MNATGRGIASFVFPPPLPIGIYNFEDASAPPGQSHATTPKRQRSNLGTNFAQPAFKSGSKFCAIRAQMWEPILGDPRSNLGTNFAPFTFKSRNAFCAIRVQIWEPNLCHSRSNQGTNFAWLFVSWACRTRFYLFYGRHAPKRVLYLTVWDLGRVGELFCTEGCSWPGVRVIRSRSRPKSNSPQGGS